MFELTETQKQLQATAREFAKKEIAPRAAEVERTEQYPWENVKQLTKQGLMDMIVPQDYSGPGICRWNVWQGTRVCSASVVVQHKFCARL